MEPDTVVMAVTAGKGMAPGTVPARAPAMRVRPPEPDDPRSGTTP